MFWLHKSLHMRTLHTDPSRSSYAGFSTVRGAFAKGATLSSLAPSETFTASLLFDRGGADIQHFLPVSIQSDPG